MAEEKVREVRITDPEWEDLAREAAAQSTDRGREVTVEDVIRAALREYVYRSEQRRKQPPA